MWQSGILVLTTGCHLVFSLEGSISDGGADADNANANRVFVTSTVHDGALGGIAGADQICQLRASEGGLAGTFVAWLSTASSHAIDRLEGSRGWVRVDGEPVADLPSDLGTFGPLVPIGLTERGIDLRAGRSEVVRTWTGTLANGGSAGDLRTCEDWTTAVLPREGTPGAPSRGGGEFSEVINAAPCEDAYHLYCFEIGKASPLVLIKEEGPLAFVSSTVWDGNGIADADALCTGEAMRAGRSETFRAAIAEPLGNISDRFTTTTHDYVRADGRRVGQVLINPLPIGFIHLTATGSLIGPSATVATGASSIGSGTNDTTCQGWAGSGDSITGSPRASNVEMFDEFLRTCAESRHVYCLQD